MSVLMELIAAAGASLGGHAVADPPRGRFDSTVEDPARLFVLEAVYEGYLMHYGSPRAFRAMDDDMRLLAGDAMYALGLARLARTGDIEAVAELADLISLTARVHAEGRPELAEELWDASAGALSEAGGPGARLALAGRLPHSA